MIEETENPLTLAHKRLVGAGLYRKALMRDALLTSTIAVWTGNKRDRWTLTAKDKRNPEIIKASRAKIDADDKWIAFLEENR